MNGVRITTPSAQEASTMVGALADILIDCVEGGASVSFLLPIERAAAEEFYTGVAAKIASGSTILFVALADGEAVGAAQLTPAPQPNQPHRADVQKLLVHRSSRNRGVARALMTALEETARSRGRTMLCLDTATGSAAEGMYEKLGWQRAGVIPRYAMWPHGGFCDTTFFWKDVAV